MSKIRVVQEDSLGEGYVIYIGRRVEITISCRERAKEIIRVMSRRYTPPTNDFSFWRDGSWFNSRRECHDIVAKMQLALVGVFDPDDD